MTLAERTFDWLTEKSDYADDHTASVAADEEAVRIELTKLMDLDCLIDALHDAGYETRQQTVDDTFVVEALRVTPSPDGTDREVVGVPYRSDKTVVVPRARIDEDALGNTETFQHLLLYFERQGPVED